VRQVTAAVPTSRAKFGLMWVLGQCHPRLEMRMIVLKALTFLSRGLQAQYPALARNLLLGPRAPSPARHPGFNFGFSWNGSYRARCSRYALIAGEGARGPMKRLSAPIAVCESATYESAIFLSASRHFLPADSFGCGRG
jgi:hypothetical protein